MKNVLIGQSGGPSSVINASLYGIIKPFKKHDIKIYGMINGIEGFIDDNYIELNSLNDEELELLKITPAMYLGSCRYKLSSDFSKPVYSDIYQKLIKLNIGYLIYIGGNDSMDTANKLNQYFSSIRSDIQIIGLPKTIDNDLYGVDHAPGFASAARYIINQVQNISYDAEIYNVKSITIIELMGRNAGWLTYSSYLAKEKTDDNPLLIYIPEIPFSFEKLFEDVEASFLIKKNIVICISEGIKTSDGLSICKTKKFVKNDSFGHGSFFGAAYVLENKLKSKFNCKTRSIILDVTQRCSTAFISKVDLKEAIEYGTKGYQSLLRGETGIMIGSERLNSNPYKLIYKSVNLDSVASKERQLEAVYINDIDAYKEYVLPLVEEGIEIPYAKGRAKYLKRNSKKIMH